MEDDFNFSYMKTVLHFPGPDVTFRELLLRSEALS